MKPYLLKNGETLTVREAQPQDAQSLLAYMNAVGGESENLLYGENEVTLSLVQEREFLENMQKNPDCAMFVGLLEGEIVASAQCGRRSPRGRIRHRGSIALAVSRSHWGKGIGRCMLEQLKVYAGEIGLEILELEVRADNTSAIALYQKMGFQQTGQYQNFFKYAPGIYADAYLMQCMLHEQSNG